MDDAPAPVPVQPSRGWARHGSSAAAWAGVFVLCALTIAALAPPAFYVWGMANSATANWQY